MEQVQKRLGDSGGDAPRSAPHVRNEPRKNEGRPTCRGAVADKMGAIGNKPDIVSAVAEVYNLARYLPEMREPIEMRRERLLQNLTRAASRRGFLPFAD